MHFSKDHEWVQFDGDIATVGITKLPLTPGRRGVRRDAGRRQDRVEGRQLRRRRERQGGLGRLRPVSGEVIEGNAALASAPETVNADPEGEGWFAKIKVSDTSTDGLMDRAAYDAFLATL